MGNPNAIPPKEYQFSATNPPTGRGRAKGQKNLKTILKRLLASQDVDKEWANPVAKKLLQKAFKEGNLQALIEIINRVEGKVPDKNLNLDGESDNQAFRDEFFGLKSPTGEQENGND